VAKPTPDQPGNGKLYICDESGKFIGRSYCGDMVCDLYETYSEDTSKFARDLNSLFQTNETIAEFPFVTSELYMLLLFEIGRRLVKDPNISTPMKEKFDKLPIKEAIQGILALFRNKKCKFQQVFLEGGNFHCFSLSPEIREKAIKEACKELEKKAKEMEKEAKEMEKEAKELEKAAEVMEKEAEEMEKEAEEMRKEAKETEKAAKEMEKAAKEMEKEATEIKKALLRKAAKEIKEACKEIEEALKKEAKWEIGEALLKKAAEKIEKGANEIKEALSTDEEGQNGSELSMNFTQQLSVSVSD